MSWLSIFIYFFSFNVFAQIYRGPISAGVGGSGRAGLQSFESGLVNPALVPILPKSELGLFYRDGYLATREHQTVYGVGGVDASKDAFFPGVLHYLQIRQTGPSTAEGHFWRFAVGKRFLERFSFGLSSQMLTLDVDDGPSVSQINYSLGALFMISENLGVAYTADNLAGASGRAPRTFRLDGRQGLGVYGKLTDLARVRFDVSRAEKRNPDHKLDYSVGVESLTNEWFLIRVGFRREELADRQYWTAGLGFEGPRLKVGYSFEKNAEGTGGAAHGVDFRVPF